MAMTDKERQELKEGMKKRLEENRKNNKNNGCLTLFLIPFVLIVIIFIYLGSPSHEASTSETDSSQNQIRNKGIPENEAHAVISDFLKDKKKDFYHSGSLWEMNPNEFSKEHNERAHVKKYNKLWVKLTNEVAIKSLTSGNCKNFEGAQVVTLTATPTNPEITIDCDGKEYEGQYTDLMNGIFMTQPDYLQKKAAEYYSKAPNEFDARESCLDIVRKNIKYPDTFDIIYSTYQNVVRPGDGGPERFISANFTAENDLGAKVHNTFYCTVTEQGHVSVRLAHY